MNDFQSLHRDNIAQNASDESVDTNAVVLMSQFDRDPCDPGSEFLNNFQNWAPNTSYSYEFLEPEIS